MRHHRFIHGEEHDCRGGSLFPSESLRRREHFIGRHAAVFGKGAIAATHDTVTDLPAGDAFAQSRHFACRFETRRAGHRCRVQAVAGDEFAAIERCGANPNHHLPGPRLRNGDVTQFQCHRMACRFDPP